MASNARAFPRALVRTLLLVGAAGVCAGASAHAMLKLPVPAAGSTVAHSPKEVAITFNEKVEAAFSAVSVKDASGKDVASGKASVDTVNPAILRVALPSLASGAYLVKWAAVGHDGHRRTGEFRFTVK